MSLAMNSSNWRARGAEGRDYRTTQRSGNHREAGSRKVSSEPTYDTRIYVGNMPYIAQRKDVERLFEDEELNI